MTSEQGIDGWDRDAIRVLTQALPLSQVGLPTARGLRANLELLKWQLCQGERGGLGELIEAPP